MTNKALFWSFFANFCTFCASLWLIKHLLSQLLEKVIFMTLCTKAITCDKAGFKSRFCQEHQAGKNIISVNPVILSNLSSCFCAFLWLKNPCNPRNPWLIKDLRVDKLLYICRETFTDVMSALQINLFMQNKANFQKVKLNVNKVLTRDYEKKTLGERGKNKPNSNPNEPKTNPIKANKMPKQTQNKPKQTQCLSAICVAGQRKKMCLDASKILTITNMDANLKKCTVFWLFIERTLFGR